LGETKAPGKFTTKSIQDIRVGDRVLADNPELSDAQRRESDPDPADWIHLSLRMAEADGGTLDIELLRPRQWVQARRAEPGRTIAMDLSEIGAVGGARVLAVGPCPPIKTGAGRVVTGTFAHAASNVIDVRLDGMDEPIGCTANHRFWSENRQAFVSAGELSVGERLRSAAGASVRVAEVTPRPSAERVYNIEIDVEHAYYVSNLGVLVHNGCASGGTPKPNTLEPGQFAGDSIPARGPARDFTAAERAQINEIGQSTGCHTCGATEPGTVCGDFIPDNQPPSALNPNGGPQQLYPQCLDCSRLQGGQVNAASR